jgi:glycosyltransferase involved in cell wall biosynthesis
VADVDECDANVGSWFVSPTSLRVGLDLDGSLESLGNSMTDLADALDRTRQCDLVRFRSRTSARTNNETHLALRALWSPLWRRSLGRSIDGLLPAVDVLHVAGLATPPTKTIPLIVSVDDLRPLRGETRTHLRITQLRRAVQRGATLVASSRSASHEVISVLGVARSRVVVVPPAVPRVDETGDGTDLVVNITGVEDLFVELAPQLTAFANEHGSRVVALASSAAGQKIRSSGLAITIRAREDARDALANARVVMHLSDGARFPSFAIAALSAGVPTLARATEINRELLAGAAALFANDHEVRDVLDEVWTNGSRRSIMVAAGRSRAVDFAPDTAARAYLSLYHEVVRGWSL